MICHSKMRICIAEPLLYSCSWDAVVRLTPVIYIECTLNFWAISSKCICGICPLFFFLNVSIDKGLTIIALSWSTLDTFGLLWGFLWQERMGCGVFCVCQTCPWHTDSPKQSRYVQYFHRLEGSSTSKYKIFKIYLDKSSVRWAMLDSNWILHLCHSLKNNYQLTRRLNKQQ